MARRIRLGDRVEISEGSGLHDRKRGVVIPHPRGLRDKYPFVACPSNLKTWASVSLDDGGITQMPKDRLRHTTEHGRGRTRGHAARPHHHTHAR